MIMKFFFFRKVCQRRKALPLRRGQNQTSRYRPVKHREEFTFHA